MISFGAKTWVSIASVLRRYSVGVLLTLGVAGASVASPSDEAWIELSRACEAVISKQSFAPLEKYEPAPFNSGKPGTKEYSVYHDSNDLIAIARILEEKKWIRCSVRESDEDRSHAVELAAEWANRFEATYPQSEYHWGNNLNPEQINPLAFRCIGESFELMIYGSLETDFHFRVVVTGELSRGMSNPCSDGET